MENKIQPTHVMGVALLHKCNFNCDHCGYIYIGDNEDHIIRPGYRMTWDQVQTAIKDCISLKGSIWNMNFTGGEPTLWEEEKFDLLDILIKVAEAGQLPSCNTNGSYFDDYGQCRDFFNRYLENSTIPLRTFISMDKFHKNYDEEKGRAKSLDNIMKYLDELPADKRELLPVHVVIIVTNDPDSSLPEEMKNYYGTAGITFGDFPMMAIGKAKELTGQLPDPPDLTDMRRNVSNGPGVLTLVGDDYYSGNKIVGKLGHMLDLYPAAN